MFGKDSSDKDYKNTNHRISQLRIHSYYYLSNIYILHLYTIYTNPCFIQRSTKIVFQKMGRGATVLGKILNN